MSLRETINKNPAIPIVGVIIVILIAGYVIYSQFSGSEGKLPTQAYYSTDDGKTWFSDDINKLPPFTVDGKEAVKVHLYKCGDKQIVGYLSKLSPQGKAAKEAYAADMAKKPTERPASHPAALQADMGGWLFKKVGDAKWTPGGVMTRIPVVCEDGKAADPVP